MICPNKNLPEWKALEKTNPELALYYWNIHNGNPPNYLTDSKVLEDLFESNPELANAVYEALGFKTDKKGIIKLVHYSSNNKNPLTDFQEDYPLYTSKGENSEYKDYGKKFNFLVKKDSLIKSLTDFHGKYGIDLDLHDQASKGIQPYSFSLKEIQSIRKEGVDILIDDFGEYIVLNPNSVVLENQQKQQAQQQYSQYLDSIFPDSKVKDIVYHGSSQEIKDSFRDNFTEEGYSNGIFFTDSKSYLKELSRIKDTSKITSVIINAQDNKKIEEPLGYGVGQYWLFEQYDSIQGKDAGQTVEGNIYAVATKNQIHILGSKQDIEGFKQFVDKGPEDNNLDIEIVTCDL